MKWLTLAFDIAVFIYEHVSGKGKRDLTKELLIAKATIKVLSKDKTPMEKGQVVEEAIGNILKLPGVKSSVCKFINKSKCNLYEKLF